MTCPGREKARQETIWEGGRPQGPGKKGRKLNPLKREWKEGNPWLCKGVHGYLLPMEKREPKRTKRKPDSSESETRPGPLLHGDKYLHMEPEKRGELEVINEEQKKGRPVGLP